MSERDSSLWVAEREIAPGLLEGPEREFFQGLDDRIVCADRGDAQTAAQEALPNLGLCIGIEAAGGPVGGPGNFMEWDASVRIGEIVPIHRVEGWDGKAVDVVVDAVLRTFAQGGAFRPKEVHSDVDGNLFIDITGTTWGETSVPDCGEPPPPEHDGPTAEDLKGIQGDRVLTSSEVEKFGAFQPFSFSTFQPPSGRPPSTGARSYAVRT